MVPSPDTFTSLSGKLFANLSGILGDAVECGSRFPDPYPKNENGCRQETGTAWGNTRVDDVIVGQMFTDWCQRRISPRTCHRVVDWNEQGLGSFWRPTD